MKKKFMGGRIPLAPSCTLSGAEGCRIPLPPRCGQLLFSCNTLAPSVHVLFEQSLYYGINTMVDSHSIGATGLSSIELNLSP